MMRAALRDRLGHVLTIGFLGVFLADTGTGIAAVLGGRALALGPAWIWLGALACLFIGLQLTAAVSRLWQGLPLPSPWRPLRLLFVIVTAGWVGLLAFGQPFHPVRVHMGLGLCVGLFSLVLTVARPLASIIPRRAVNLGELVLTNICLALLGGELTLRFVSEVWPTPILARTNDSVRQVLREHRYPPGLIRYGYSCNSAGYYDGEFTPSPPGERLVVSIGDSFSVGVVPLPYHFTQVLERMLSATAIHNMGVASSGPPEYLYLLQTEGLLREPDLVLVNLFVGNDPYDSLRWNRGYRRLRSWFERTNVLLFVVPPRVLKLHSEGRKTGELDQGATANPATEISRADLEQTYPWIVDPTLEKPSISQAAFLEIETDRAGQLSAPTSFYEPLFTVLTEIARAVGDTTLVISLIPDEFQVNDELWEQVRARLPLPGPDRFRPQALIRTWLEEHGVSYLDLLPALRSVEPLTDGRRHVYRLRDTHFNVRGNEVAGKALAAYLIEHHGFALSPAVRDR